MNIFRPFMSAAERSANGPTISPGELRKRRFVGLVWAAVWSFPVISLVDDIVRATSYPVLAIAFFAAYIGLYLYLIKIGRAHV